MKYVLVSGGVISGVGKGIIACSTGFLMKTTGLKVTMIKIDPYLNVDAGTMAPKEHGEVFVLDDGGETDLDLGNYERYLNISLTSANNITTGKIFQHVIERERSGRYLGKTVQIIPHLTDALQEWIEKVAKAPVDETKGEPEMCVIELGGTLGDIENAPLRNPINDKQKTKPTQQAIKEVRGMRLYPDLIACRCKELLKTTTIEKVTMFCQVEPEEVLAVHDIASTYYVPDVLKSRAWCQYMETWRSSTSQEDLIESIDIALLGKYTEAADSYISVIRALEHAAMTCRRTLKLHLIESSYLEELSRELQPEKYEQECHIVRTAKGILVPGGFGTRGTEGMIAAAKWARENKIPFLGVCLGANSIEFDENTAHPVVISMLEIDQEKLGGTMRLGMRLTLFQLGSEWTNIHRIYSSSGPTCLSSSHFASRLENEASTRFPKVATSNPKVPSLIIHERHRHRYEVNPAYTSALTSHGMDFVGKDDRGERMEILELREHPWFVGVQFHPEHLSRVLEPSQPYLGFLTASAGCFEEIVGKGKSKHA